MNVLLDESVPRALKTRLPGHAVKTVHELGWAGIKNGELLRRANEAFDVLFTADKNLPHQQNLAGSHLTVLILPTNRVPDLMRLLPSIEISLRAVRPGTFSALPPTAS